MNKLARNRTNGFSIHVLRKMMKSTNNNRWTPDTIRNAVAIPSHVAIQQAMPKERYNSMAMMKRKNKIVKVAAVNSRTTLSITSSFTYSV